VYFVSILPPDAEVSSEKLKRFLVASIPGDVLDMPQLVLESFFYMSEIIPFIARLQSW